MGGGFGSKFGPNEEGIICAKLAKMANAPVKLMLTRWDEQMGNFNGPGSGTKIRAGASADGTLKAVQVETWGNGGIGSGGNPTVWRPLHLPRGERARRERPTSTPTPAAPALSALPATRRRRSSWKR